MSKLNRFLLFFIFLFTFSSLCYAINGNAQATISINNTGPTMTAPILIPSNPNMTSIMNCSNGNYSDVNNDPIGGKEWRWYFNSILTGYSGQYLNLSSTTAVVGDNVTCSVRANDTYMWGPWSNQSNGVIILATASNVSIISTSIVPTAADDTQTILFNVTAYDTNPLNILTAYCSLYKNGVFQSQIINNVTNNVSTNACNISSALTNPGENWYIDVYVSNTFTTSPIYTSSLVSIGAQASTPVVQSLYNKSAQIDFTTLLSTNHSISYSITTNLNNSVGSNTFSTTHTSNLYDLTPGQLYYFNVTTWSTFGTKEVFGYYNFTYSCVEFWSCTDFGACVNYNGTYLKNRTCTDTHMCGTNLSKPAEQQVCAIGGAGGGPTFLQIKNVNTLFKENNVELILSEYDSIEFSILDENHTLVVNSIFQNYANFEIRSNPQVFNLDVNESKDFDLNGDNWSDVRIELNKIYHNNGTRNQVLIDVHRMYLGKVVDVYPTNMTFLEQVGCYMQGKACAKYGELDADIDFYFMGLILITAVSLYLITSRKPSKTKNYTWHY